MDTELASLVRGGGYDATLITLPSDDNSFAPQCGIEQFFDRHEEGVHIDVKDGFEVIWQGSCNTAAIVRQSRQQSEEKAFKRRERRVFAEIAEATANPSL
jgi:hypothetical protein